MSVCRRAATIMALGLILSPPIVEGAAAEEPVQQGPADEVSGAEATGTARSPGEAYTTRERRVRTISGRDLTSPAVFLKRDEEVLAANDPVTLRATDLPVSRGATLFLAALAAWAVMRSRKRRDADLF